MRGKDLRASRETITFRITMTNTAARTTRLYYVAIRMVWDRPALRGATYTYRPVAHTTDSSRIATGDDCARALGLFREHVSGGMDSLSEYIGTVEVYSTDLDGQDARTVRKAVYRVRDAGAEHAVTVATEAEQFDRRMAAKDADAMRAAA